MTRIHRLLSLHVAVLACSAITRELSETLRAAGVRVVSQVVGSADDAIAATIDKLCAEGASNDLP